jgi:hypothetical protein
MISIENISDDMAYTMLSQQSYINLMALIEMGGPGEPQIHKDIAAAVHKGAQEFSGLEREKNEIFIREVLARRPQTNDLLIKLGVLSFWDGVIRRAKNNSES